MTEFWTFGSSEASQVADWAKRVESEGWDGIMFVDSQNLRVDCYVAMTVATCATSTLKVSPGVTNPATRHPAVSASAIAAIHETSGGRASYGIGRGDSALAYIGMKPSSLAVFERYVKAVRRYLRGERIPFEELSDAPLDLDDLNLHDQPDVSWLRWLDPALPPVPVEVVATGPKAIAIGGRHADIVTFTVGADLDRISWGISEARKAAAASGRDPSELEFGVYVNVGCHPEIEVARRVISGGLASFARFAAMQSSPTGPMNEDSAEVLQKIRSNYDMKHHGEPNSPQTAVMSDEFIDRYGIVGDVAACAEKIRAIEALGVSKIVITPPNQAAREVFPSESEALDEHLVRGLLPSLRPLGRTV